MRIASTYPPTRLQFGSGKIFIPLPFCEPRPIFFQRLHTFVSFPDQHFRAHDLLSIYFQFPTAVCLLLRTPHCSRFAAATCSYRHRLAQFSSTPSQFRPHVSLFEHQMTGEIDWASFQLTNSNFLRSDLLHTINSFGRIFCHNLYVNL
jgi:hypothetical protein